MDKLKQRLTALHAIIEKHNHLYYNLARPVISDVAYDQLFQELLAIEAKYPQWVTKASPSQKVGSPVASKVKKWRHDSPMLSLGNCFDYEALCDFHNTVQEKFSDPVIYSCEPKIDGLALSIVYYEGALLVAATRGDGFVGEQVTQSVPHIAGIPNKIPNHYQKIEIRGEVYMARSTFAKLAQQETAARYSNPRNAAAGKLRMLEGTDTPLQFIGYQIVQADKQQTPLDMATTHAYLRAWQVGSHTHFLRAKTIAQCAQHHKYLQTIRDRLDFEIDGMVIKVDSGAKQQQLGQLSRQPRWAIAYKFAAQEAQTKLLAVKHQVGKTGVITPVAVLAPVLCGGVTVQKASLHNHAEIMQLGIRINDQVAIKRAGDVIPKVTKKIITDNEEQAQPIITPSHCPACASPLVQELVYLRCPNQHACSEQLRNRLLYFCSKPAMNIVGLGASLIDRLLKLQRLRSFADIYKLQKEDLLALALVQEKTANNLLAAIDKSRKTTLSRLLTALSIPGVGADTALRLAQYFGSFTKIRTASVTDLATVRGLASYETRQAEKPQGIAHAIVRYFSDTTYSEQLDALLEQLRIQAVQHQKKEKIVGKRFVLTGTLSQSRDLYAQQLKDGGAYVTNSVSKNTDYLVVGEKPGSKLAKAQALNISVLQEHALRDLLE